MYEIQKRFLKDKITLNSAQRVPLENNFARLAELFVSQAKLSLMGHAEFHLRVVGDIE